MSLSKLIEYLRRSLMVFGDDSSEQALDMIEGNKNLAFSRYILMSDIDFGLIESFASKCYHARLFMENMKYEDVDFLENICTDTMSNDMLMELLKLYNLLTNMTGYFDTLDTNMASRDFYYSYNGTIKISNDLINVLRRDLIKEEAFQELSNTLLEIYDTDILESRNSTKELFEQAIEYEDLFLFESAFSDMNMLKLDAIGLTSNELKVMLRRLSNRLDIISDDLSMELLREISPLLFRHMDSEIDLNEKDIILRRKVNERI